MSQTELNVIEDQTFLIKDDFTFTIDIHFHLHNVSAITLSFVSLLILLVRLNECLNENSIRCLHHVFVG